MTFFPLSVNACKSGTTRVSGAAALAALLGAAGSALWVWAAAAGLAGLAVYPLMAARIARRRGAEFADPRGRALLYGALTMAAKPFELLGAWRYAQARRRGERGTIIEYK